MIMGPLGSQMWRVKVSHAGNSMGISFHGKVMVPDRTLKVAPLEPDSGGDLEVPFPWKDTKS